VANYNVPVNIILQVTNVQAPVLEQEHRLSPFNLIHFNQHKHLALILSVTVLSSKVTITID
jgi:hypothetical protein